MPKITNEKYASWLKGELVEPLTRKEFIEGLTKIGHKSPKEARVLMILLWMTAARPNEVLRLTGNDFRHEKSMLKVKLKGSKGSYAGEIALPIKDELVKEAWSYAQSRGEPQYLFPSFITIRRRTTISRT